MPQKDQPKNQIMNVREVSEFLRIPLSTVYELAKKGKIRGVKFGKHWRFVREDILSYLYGNRTLRSNLPIRTSEKREYARMNCEIPAHFEVLLSGRKITLKNGMLENLSESGAFLGADTGQMQTGDPIRIAFVIPKPNTTKLECEARIVHASYDGKVGYGIKFRGLSAREEAILHDYVG